MLITDMVYDLVCDQSTWDANGFEQAPMGKQKAQHLRTT